MDKDERPLLRRIEIVPAIHRNRQVLVLKDPLRLSDGMVSVPFESSSLLAMLDGTNTPLDIQAALTRSTGQIAPSEQIRHFIEVLDSQYLLDNERFRRRLNEVNEVYLSCPVRPMSCAEMFPDEPDECAALLDSFAVGEGGPGPISTLAIKEGDGTRRMVGLLAPHIDYFRGSACYAHAYKALAEQSDAETVIVFGTDHQGLAQPFSITDRAFATPFGKIEADRALFDRVSIAMGGQLGDQVAHRQEHSIELAAIWLAHIARKMGRSIKMLPILLGGLSDQIAADEAPDSDERLAAMLQALRQSVAEHDAPVAYVASADLAHIGPQFGDDRPLGEDDLARSAEADQELLRVAAAGVADAFFEAVARERDQRRICGLAPIYAMLACLHDLEGELLQYGQWRDDHGMASVSFAAMVFHRRSP